MCSPHSEFAALMCLVSAKNAGDPFPVRGVYIAREGPLHYLLSRSIALTTFTLSTPLTETMIVDGIGTMIASFFGSPFGTVVYIGHPAYKRSGALVGYSLTNGIIYLFLSWFGILALVQSIVNQATIGPIVLFV
jgi:AGZA family xanthine/uracil permease-like MFS transporter